MSPHSLLPSWWRHEVRDFWLTCLGIGTVAGLILILVNASR